VEVKPGYKTTEAGIIPKAWDVDFVENLAHITTGGRNTQDRAEDGQYPFFVRSQTVERINSYSFDGEAVLTAGDGVGTGKVFHYINGKFDVHQRVYRISNFSRRLNGYFFYLYFSTHFYNRIMQMTAKSSVDSVRMEMIARMPVPLPPIDTEQRAIVAALSDVNALWYALDSLIAKKRDLKQAAMQQFLTSRRRLPGFRDMWEQRRLDRLLTEGPTNGYSGPAGATGDGTPTLKLSATSSGGLVLNAETVKRLNETIPSGSDLFLRPGDLLIQRSNTPDLVGTAAIFDGPPDTYVYPDLMMRLRFQDESITQWIWRYANTGAGREFLLSIAAGSSGSMVKISGHALRAMMVPIPPRAERVAIATILSDIDAEIAALEARRDKTRALKQGMMQELLTGRVRLV
jgi:type I restriction enzyme, S subunit